MAEFYDDWFHQQGDIYGPYQDLPWGPAEQHFWTLTAASDPRDYDAMSEFNVVEQAFYGGWMDNWSGMSYEEHEEWRQVFYELTGLSDEDFDWDAFRDYLAEYDSLGVS